jgi:hypothetical protein
MAQTMYAYMNKCIKKKESLLEQAWRKRLSKGDGGKGPTTGQF